MSCNHQYRCHCFCIHSGSSDVSDEEDEDDYYQIRYQDYEDEDVYGDLVALKNTSTNGGPRKQPPHTTVISDLYMLSVNAVYIYDAPVLTVVIFLSF